MDQDDQRGVGRLAAAPVFRAALSRGETTVRGEGIYSFAATDFARALRAASEVGGLLVLIIDVANHLVHHEVDHTQRAAIGPVGLRAGR
jgi:hypothetical protein